MSVIAFISEAFTTIKIIFLYGWPFILLAWIFILKNKWKNWPVEAIIIEKRGDNLIKTSDRAGKYIDPYTKMTGYRLQKSKDSIPVVNYDWVLHHVPVATTFFERIVNLIRPNIGTLFFFRYGSKQYKPIKIREEKNVKITYQEFKDKDGNPIYNQIYQQFDPRDKLGALDFEVVDWDNMNFMVQEQRASMERRQKKGEFLKQILIPLGLMLVAALVCIIMIKFSYDYALEFKNSNPSSYSTPSPAEVPNIPIINDLVPGT